MTRSDRRNSDESQAPAPSAAADANIEGATQLASQRIPATDAREHTEDETAPEKEIGGRGGLDPVRYGDWEKNGRCIDF
jgi:hypothetical protein